MKLGLLMRMVGLMSLTSALIAILPAQAQVTPSGQGPRAATRIVAQYYALERTLEDHLWSGRTTQVMQVLAQDFIARDAVDTPYELRTWIDHQRAKASKNTSKRVRMIDQLDAQPLGTDLVAASFLRRDPAQRCPSWIVDVWRVADDKLVARYESTACTPTESGATQPPPRPSGRE